MTQTFHAPKEAFNLTTVTLTGDEYRHATRSCRVRIGETIAVTDGCGRRVEAEISAIDARKLTAEITRDVSGYGEPPLIITVALAVIRPSRFETAVEKCTELGARAFIPVIAQRCETAPERLNPDRLRKIAFESAKQAGRSWVPEMKKPTMISDLSGRAEGIVLVAVKSAEHDMVAALKPVRPGSNISLLVGPEGDFTDEEYDMLLKAGALPVSLGGLTLRAETAAITATALCAMWRQRG